MSIKIKSLSEVLEELNKNNVNEAFSEKDLLNKIEYEIQNWGGPVDTKFEKFLINYFNEQLKLAFNKVFKKDSKLTQRLAAEYNMTTAEVEQDVYYYITKLEALSN